MLPDKEMIVSARRASDGERIISAGKPFLQFSFKLNKTGERIPLVKFHAKDEKISYQAAELKEALRTFRGTLINGILQPNVRLSNGLTLRGMHNITVNAEPRTLHETPKVTRNAETKSQVVKAQEPVGHLMSEIAYKELALQARERELALREELLQWKQKTFGLAQKLAKQSSGENRTQRRLRTMSKNLDSNDRSFGSRSWKDNARPRTRPKYSDETGYGYDSRYPADDIRPRKKDKYRDEYSHSSDSRDSVEDALAAIITDYKVRADGGASPERAQLLPDANIQTTHHTPPVVENSASMPSDSFDGEKPSAHEDQLSESTSDMVASSVLGTDTSAPPALDGLRTLIAELDKMDKRDKPSRRRRSRSR
jgi:myosin heavy subunit